LYFSTQCIVRRGKRFPKYYTLRIKGTTRGKHVRRGKRFTNTTLPELKAPPVANMSQKEISANMNPPNILGEPPVQDEDMDLHEQPVEGEERSLSGISTFGKNNNNGLLFAPTCTTCFNKNKNLSASKKSVPTNGIMSALIALESMFFFPRGCFIVDTTMTNPTRFSYKCNYSMPQPSTPMSYNSHDPL
jgi:hypothetical protein